MLGTTPDLLRLLVVPVFGWAAWRDVRTRRVSNRVWYPLVVLGVITLVWDTLSKLPLSGFEDRLFLIRVGFSLLFLVPFAYGLWWIGGFGGADAKALMTLAVLFPTYPVYYLPFDALPMVRTTVGVFSMTILTNTVIVGIAYPLLLALRNAIDGDVAPLMFVGRRVPVSALPTVHGRLFETKDGFTRHGLDLDALRMYLRWRGTSLDALRADPEHHRDPASIDETYEVGDGAVDPAHATDGGVPADAADEDIADYDDPWGAAAFLDAIEGSAYGTTPEDLREGLDVVVARDEIWISPGIPFLVPMFGGLVVSLTYGDAFFSLLRALGWA